MDELPLADRSVGRIPGTQWVHRSPFFCDFHLCFLLSNPSVGISYLGVKMCELPDCGENCREFLFGGDAEEETTQAEAGRKKPVTTMNDLPDELVQLCFARMPFRYAPRAKAVCKRWYELGNAPYIYQLRRNLGLTESFTYILANEYEQGCYKALQGHAYDSSHQKCRPIAPLISPHRLQFAAAAGADGLLYILGGRSPLISRRHDSWVVFSRVDVYDPICNSWYQVKSMKSSRFGFAAGSFTDRANNQPKLIVAGGYDVCGLALPLAEMYDPRRDEWESVPSMQNMSGACKGEIYKGKFYVKQANNGPEAIEVFDPCRCCWSTCSSKEISNRCFQNSDNVCSGGKIILDL